MMTSKEMYEAYDELRLFANNIGFRPFTTSELTNIVELLSESLDQLEAADVTEYAAMAQLHDVLERLQFGLFKDERSKKMDEERGFFLEQ